MYQLQEKKTVAISLLGITNGGTANSGAIDTLGFDAASVDVILSASNNTTNVPTVLLIQSADVTNTSSAANITANGQVSYGTGTNATTATANSFSLTSYYTTANTSTSKADVCTWDLALTGGGKGRYLFVTCSPVTTQTITIVANLYRGALAPSKAVDKNVQVWETL